MGKLTDMNLSCALLATLLRQGARRYSSGSACAVRREPNAAFFRWRRKKHAHFMGTVFEIATTAILLPLSLLWRTGHFSVHIDHEISIHVQYLVDRVLLNGVWIDHTAAVQVCSTRY